MKTTRRMLTAVLAILMILAPIKIEELKNTVSYTAEYESFTLEEETSDIQRVGDSAYPSSYSLVNEGAVTSVKSQGSYGTCWAFATVASAESSALKSGLGNLDLSELHLAYYSFNKATDSLGLTAGDTTTAKLSGSETILDAGGDLQMATMVLAGGVGFVNESALSYDKAASIANGSYIPSSSLTYSANYYLTDANWVSTSNRDAIKSLLMNKGAVATSYYEGKSTGSYYNEATYGYYCADSKTPNHGITIVGWDDNYSASNFLVTPAGNGAWLVKNSWGSNSRNNGYFWISYYDAGFSPIAAQFNIATYSGLNNIYQYDGTANVSKLVFSKSTVRLANVYTSATSESLQKVGFYTSEPNISYTVSIYLNPSDANPSSGTLVASTSGCASYAGYHTVNLNNKVSLNTADKFSVVVEMTTTSSKLGVYVDASSNGTYFTFNNSVSAGQSYYQYVGSESWKDLESAGKTARIKAYTFVESSNSQVPTTTTPVVEPTSQPQAQPTSQSASSNTTPTATPTAPAASTETTVAVQPTEEKTVVPTVTRTLGDVNGDGVINSLDYVLIKNYIMNASSLTGESDRYAADFNQDGKINSLDYVAVKNHIMGS